MMFLIKVFLEMPYLPSILLENLVVVVYTLYTCPYLENLASMNIIIIIL